MGDGRGDSQRVWHEYVGRLLTGKTILDVGAGIGLSKARLAAGGNTVTTQDIDRALMRDVDLVCDLAVLAPERWDVVTAFDVVEHVPAARAFLMRLRSLARQGVFFTTPNHALYPHPWHFTAEEFEALARFVGGPVRWFARYKEGHRDEGVELPLETLVADATIYAFGAYVTRRA